MSFAKKGEALVLIKGKAYVFCVIVFLNTMLNPFNDVNNIVRTMMRLIDYARFSCAFDHEIV